MVKKVPDSSILPKPPLLHEITRVNLYLGTLTRVLQEVISALAYRVNRMMSLDGSDGMTGPLVVKTYTVATVPTAADSTQGIIYVSDETGGSIIAFSDGTNWRRVTDRTIVA